MFTVLGFSFGFLALGAAVAVINVLTTIFTVAFTVYASLAVIGTVVFTVKGIRRLRRGVQEQRKVPDLT
ncbi:hypothetical protein [Mycobacterium paraterrae]|uniref:Transmembrane protein n=1 Tax=Mycobacterium paraterrae TaxID=577492 RepID=A0ABY3VDZ1_9MYCO|nr:hypothetical protein [Mycobacterium paraterrae]UMB67643.1 hypothetical protein MKK62_14085 [Mycobacterium paraterrae]